VLADDAAFALAQGDTGRWPELAVPGVQAYVAAAVLGTVGERLRAAGHGPAEVAAGIGRILARCQVVPSRRSDFVSAPGDRHGVTAAAARRVRASVLGAEGAAAADAAGAIAMAHLAEQQGWLIEELDERIDRVLRHGQYIMGPEVAELEQRLVALSGASEAIAVASGTMALEIALRALGIGPGDEVITTPFTWIASAEVIALVGATPVFADIEPAGFTLDPTAVAAALTPRTRAIIPVGLFGQMPLLEQLAAAAPGIPLIEDAAQSFGATRHGRASGAATLIGCTSFFPSKPLGGYGDGGAILTSDERLAARCRAIRTHGGERRHQHHLVGTNGRMDTLQAAVVLAKLGSFAGEIAQRRALAARYDAALPPACRTPAVLPGNTHVFAQYTVRVAGRDALAQRLAAQGIASAVFYPRCLHQQPVFAALGHAEGSFPHAERAAQEVLSLPVHPALDAAAQERVVRAIAP
jgi:UDP-2-acetamido-2-deoxy-ribo-hexuluronate aminotransferase